MSKKTYSITLGDGTILDNLTRDGGAYISSDIIDLTIFTDNLFNVVITDGGITTEYTYMNLDNYFVDDEGQTHFTLLRADAIDLKFIEIDAGMEYVKMRIEENDLILREGVTQ